MRKKIISILITLVLIFCFSGCDIVGVKLGDNSNYEVNSSYPLATPTSKPTISAIPSHELEREENIQLETMRKSVVEIYAITEKGAGAGSGVIFGYEQTQDQKYIAYIVTCHHVINSAYYANVRDINGKIFPAGLIGSNPNGDIAVIWAEFNYLPSVATFGKSSDLVVGEEVYAIGNPTGSLGGTVTKGIISSTMREMYVDGFHEKLTLLQLDSAINSGNSGGGLFTTDGYYIGMPNAGYTGKDGLGFAIPSDIVLQSVNHLISTYSQTNYGYIPGMGSAGLSISNALEIVGLTDEGSYKASGVKVGDIVKSVEIDGESYSPTSGTDFLQYLATKDIQAGDSYKLTVIRNGNEKQLTITVKQLIYIPPTPPQAKQNSQIIEDELKTGTKPLSTMLSDCVCEQILSIQLEREPNQILEKNRSSSVEVYSTVGLGSTSVGSGVFVGFEPNEKGEGGTAFVVTNHHVINGGYDIKVKNLEGKEYDAGIIGSDVSEDLALLWVEVDYSPECAIIADSNDILVGETVYAIGNPLGTLGGTVTKGIISATSREILMGDYYMNLMQTDAAVNNGNSGGGLFSEDGYLVGLVNGGMPSQDGIGFAIPASSVLTAVNAFLSTYMDEKYGSFGYIEGKPYIGATFSDGIMLASSQKVVYISAIESAGSFYKAGLRKGDNILAISYNGGTIEFNNATELMQGISYAKLEAGKALTVTFSRSNQTYQTSVVLSQYIYVPPTI